MSAGDLQHADILRLRSKSRRSILSAVAVAGLALGYLLGVFTLRRDLLVDYDSGALRHVVTAGPFTLCDERLPSVFAAYPLPNGSLSLRGVDDWHIVTRFVGRSKYSAFYDGGIVAEHMAHLGRSFPELGLDQASRTKLAYLKAIADGDRAMRDKVLQQTLEAYRVRQRQRGQAESSNLESAK